MNAPTWPAPPTGGRVATLVARGAAPEEVFTAVAGELRQLLRVELATLFRYEPGRTASSPATQTLVEVCRLCGSPIASRDARAAASPPASVPHPCWLQSRMTATR